MSYAYKAVLQCGHETTIETQHPHGPGYSYHHAFCEECRLNMAVLKAEPVEDVAGLPEYASFVQAADAEDVPAAAEPAGETETTPEGPTE